MTTTTVPTQEFRNIPPSALHSKAPPPRAFDALTASVREYGVLQPLLVMRVGLEPHATFIVIDGVKRCEAAAEVGLEVVPCLVIDEVSEDAWLDLRFASNMRGDLTASLDDVADAAIGTDVLLAALERIANEYEDDECRDVRVLREAARRVGEL